MIEKLYIHPLTERDAGNKMVTDKINEIIDVVNARLCKHPDCVVPDAHTHNLDGSVCYYL